METASGACDGRSQLCTPPVPKAAPWLVFPYGEGKESQAFFNICEPDNRTCRKSIPELSTGTSFWQKTCHQGWLIVLCNHESHKYSSDWEYGDCFLWNPASLEKIRLPSLLEWVDKPKEYVLIDCVLTSPPPNSIYEHEDEHESMVLFLFGCPLDEKHVFLLFCHPGEKQWRVKNIPFVFNSRDMSLCSFKGKLYLLYERADSLLEIEKQELLDDNIESLSLKPLELSTTTRVVQPPEVFADCLFIAESDDEIFKVLISYIHGSNEVMEIDLWRLDFSLMKWEEMNSLGDHVIFAGTNTGVCCSAANLGLKSGCLYYTLPGGHSLYKFKLYKFKLNSTSNAIMLPCLEPQTTRFQSEWIMIMPNDSCKRLENMSGKNEAGEEKNVTLEAVENRATSNNSDEIQDNEKHNKEETSPWSILNEDMLALVANCLHPFDYGRFRSVSKRNLQIMPKIKLPEFYSTGCPYLAPWLVFSKDNTYSFVNSENHHETYLMNFCDVLQGATIRCQKEGWLLMSRESKIFFYKPFTGEIIQLPDLPELPEEYNYSSICFDSPPTHPIGCIVFAVAQSPSRIYFLVTGTGEDCWEGYSYLNAKPDEFLPLCSAPIIYKQVLYCIDCNGTLGTYDLFRDGLSWSVLTKPRKIFNDDMNPIFLVKCGGDLLLVKLGHLGMPVRIFRLDFSEMEWVKVETLGKYMLFVNKTSCLSVLAPNSSMENRIYFPRLCLNGEGILYYSLETNSYCSSGQNQPCPNNFYETESWLSNCIWIQPNWSKSTAQELDWFRD